MVVFFWWILCSDEVLFSISLGDACKGVIKLSSDTAVSYAHQVQFLISTSFLLILVWDIFLWRRKRSKDLMSTVRLSSHCFILQEHKFFFISPKFILWTYFRSLKVNFMSENPLSFIYIFCLKSVLIKIKYEC